MHDSPPGIIDYCHGSSPIVILAWPVGCYLPMWCRRLPSLGAASSRPRCRQPHPRPHLPRQKLPGQAQPDAFCTLRIFPPRRLAPSGGHLARLVCRSWLPVFPAMTPRPVRMVVSHVLSGYEMAIISITLLTSLRFVTSSDKLDSETLSRPSASWAARVCSASCSPDVSWSACSSWVLALFAC